MDPNGYRIVPEPNLVGLERDSVHATKSSTPSFNDYHINVGNREGYAKANRWLVMIFPNANVLGLEETSKLESRKTNKWGTTWDIFARRAYEGNTKLRSTDIVRLATTCKSVTLTEQSWYTTEQADLNAGASRIFPYKKNTNNASGLRLQFNMGADMFEKEFFDYWMRYIQVPSTKQFRYYDDYTKGSEIYVILLPHKVSDFYQAIGAVFSNPSKITGYKFTEVYPYLTGINGSALNYQTANEPMYLDVAMMFRDIVPLTTPNIPQPSNIMTVRDNGFPYIDSSWAQEFLRDAMQTYKVAFDGHVIGQENAQREFQLDQREREITNETDRIIRELYTVDIPPTNITLPRAVDGLVQYPPPNNGALNLGLSLLSQVQGFFGAGFFGNGFNPP